MYESKEVSFSLVNWKKVPQNIERCTKQNDFFLISTGTKMLEEKIATKGEDWIKLLFHQI